MKVILNFFPSDFFFSNHIPSQLYLLFLICYRNDSFHHYLFDECRAIYLRERNLFGAASLKLTMFLTVDTLCQYFLN